ncbi:MAG: tRNA lysidine(34) synthetase TilS [Actinobacteria bacterium]|nr:tRNA lysidine(34) synthetase TilS [Actinomycetota bacterium]
MATPHTVGALPAGLRRQEIVSAVREALDAAVVPGATCVVALSGGPDSTALVHLTAEARPDLRLHAVHVRHGLREDLSDARVAAHHAAALGIGHSERRVRVRDTGAGLEAAARDSRYAALREAATGLGAGWVLVGHTADDRAETLVLNLSRGGGLRGLAAMAARRPDGPVEVLRPLLRLRRRDVHAFVEGEGLRAVSDPTNRDPEQRRFRARTRALPALGELAGGPGDPVGALTRLADLAGDDAEALDVLAARHARRLVHAWGPVRAVEVRALGALPRALAARVVRDLLAAVRGDSAGLDAETLLGVLRLAPGGARNVPGGVWVTCGGGWLAAAPPDAGELPARPVPVPGVTALPEIGQALHADTADVDDRGQGRLDRLDERAWGPDAGGPGDQPPGPLGAPPPGAMRAPARYVLLDDRPDGLVVRARRPGDRLRLAGGRRKVADLFVDLGVPRALRGLVPVVADAHDEPVWVPGVGRRMGDGPRREPVRLWLASTGRRLPDATSR